MADNGAVTEERVILKAVLNADNKIEFTIKSNHIPTLDFIVNSLMYHIIELRAMEKTKEEISQKIIKPHQGGIIDYLRRGSKR